MRLRQARSKQLISRAIFILTVTALAVLAWTNLSWQQAAAPPRSERAKPLGPAQPVHPLLRSIFICITFKWKVDKTVYLEQVLSRAASYPTHVDICIVSDAPGNVQNLLAFWDYPQARACGAWHEVNTTADPFALVWEHRAVVENATATGAHTMFVYLEDDTDVGWPALQSWAADTEVLEPLGFLRGLWRTEISLFTGKPVFMDVFWQCDLALWNRTLEVEVPARRACAVVNAGDSMWRWREAPAGCRHRHYISLPAPYNGLWIASRSQLMRFMASTLWPKAGALAFDKPAVLHRNQNAAFWPWGPPERSTGMIQFLDVPKGFWSRSVVPYDPKKRVLLPAAQVGHSRNAWSSHAKHQVDATAFFQ